MSTFRFYGELNDFLPSARRQAEFRVSCAADCNLKHLIEVLGVPHTEVDLILVNGEPAGFDRLMQDKDRVAVYPGFRALDIMPTLRPPPGNRFVADAHLGGLARLLRMAGFDTLYSNGYQDRALAELAVGEDRILLSRDRDLLKRGAIVHGCYVHALAPQAQFREVMARLGLERELRPFTRCLNCNEPLRAVGKVEVLDSLPPSVRARRERFTTCDRCGGIFWEGSHWQRMRALLEESLRQPVP